MQPVFSLSSRRSLFSLKRVISSSDANGSSIKITLGRVAKALAIETRIFIPPESCRGNIFSQPSNLTILSAASISGLADRKLNPFSLRGSHTFFSTVAQGINVGSWNTTPTDPAPCSTFHSIRPEVGSAKPAIKRSAVDFPHPDGPSKLIKSLSSTPSEKFRKASTPPGNVFTTSMSSTRVSCLPFSIIGSSGRPINAARSANLNEESATHWRESFAPRYSGFNSMPTPLPVNSLVNVERQSSSAGTTPAATIFP